MFERFTAEARAVIADAQEQARRIGHNYIGCEHLLLAAAGSATHVGAVLKDAGVTAKAVEEEIATVVGPLRGDNNDDDDDGKATLATLGIDLDQVRDAAEKTFGPGALRAVRKSRRRPRRLGFWRRPRSCTIPTDHQRFTPRAERCLELSLREALRRKHDFIGVEHIAVSLLSRDDTVAWGVLLRLGVIPADLSRTIQEWLRRTA